MRGNYTRYGPVEQKLLAHADDQLVVMATGDEITVRFNATRLPAAQARMEAGFLPLHPRLGKGRRAQHSLCLGTVQPLPFRKMVNYPPTAQGTLRLPATITANICASI